MRDKSYKSKIIKNAFITFVVIILMLNSFKIQVYADENVTEEIKEILDKYYIEDVPQDTINENSVNAIINNLHDPYTQIMGIDDYYKYLENSFFGIGITIEMTQEGALINTVMVNSPAMESGLLVGDIIIVADDTNLGGLSINNALNILNGNVGVRCELKVLRKNDLLKIDVVPAKVYHTTVNSEIIDKHIAYINIMSFGKNTLEEFKDKVNYFSKQSVDSYIIDLRNNPGGYIYSAIEIAGFFVENNTVTIAKNKSGVEYEFNAVEVNRVIDKPIIFLVNKHTASAAELLAACVQDYNKAIIIGEPTYGKGLVQSNFTLSDGSILKTTTLKLYSPKGKDINKIGVSPDIYLNDVDSLIVGQLLLGSENKLDKENKIVKIVINNKNYYVNMDKIKNRDYWEAYRQIISNASFIDATCYSNLSQNNKIVNNNYPVLKYAEVPKTEYKVGDRVTFKLSAPNYNGLVQYRAMLWNETTNRYVDLWNTKDRYYDKWRPRGKDVFTISFPAKSAGNYRIKIFVKRNGILNSKAALKGVNCDSYVYEIPYVVVAN